MDLKELQENWNKFGLTDPFWSVLAWPDKAENRWQIDEFFETGRREIDDVLAYVNAQGLSVGRERALDFGCGVGRLSQALARHFQRVDGVDISPAMLTLAQTYNQFPDRVHYHQNEVDDLSLFPDAVFDFIYSNITLQHMQPRYARAYMAEFLRVLGPNGALVFQIPAQAKRWRHRLIQPLKPTRLFRFYQRLRYRDQPVMNMYGIPKNQVVRWLQAHGGRVVDIQPDQSADALWHSFRYLVIKD
ncbi:MAG: class I SAM-dependent methyltransferase [Chloroflexi bacterium]|nr:class I SAM-dependent methyltransferase [Chloroflexota bacterium]